jgi:hypothetical protein
MEFYGKTYFLSYVTIPQACKCVKKTYVEVQTYLYTIFVFDHTR